METLLKDLSASLEDYLEVILDLSEERDNVRVTDIADTLGIAKPSVSQALTILNNQRLVKQERYGPVRLTAEGEKRAKGIRLRHRVLYRFLVEVLKVDPLTAEKDACSIEHVVSSATLFKLTRYLSIENKELSE